MRLAELLLELGRFAEAQSESRAVLDSTPEDPQALRTLALGSYYAARTGKGTRWSNASEALKKAIKLNPDDIQLATCLADVYRVRLDSPEPEKADAVFDQLVQKTAQSPAALLARSSYRQQFKLPGASDDLALGLKKAPADPSILQAAADDAFRARRWDEAADLYTSLTKVRPTLREGYLGLGQVYRQQHAIDQALTAWRTGLEKVGEDDFLIGWPLCDLLIEQRRLEEADRQLTTLESSVEKSRGRLSRPTVQAMSRATDYLRAKWWLAGDKPFQAIQILERLAVVTDSQAAELRISVTQPQVQWLRAVALAGISQWDQAAMAYERVVTLQPANLAARLAAANAWLAAGQYDAAVAQFEIAQYQPNPSSDAWLPYAQSLYLQELRTAPPQRNWTAFENAFAKIPIQGPAAWQRDVLESEYAANIGQLGRALTLLDRAEHSHSDNESCLRAVAEVYQKIGKPAEADRALESAQKVGDDSVALLFTRAEILANRSQESEATTLLQSALATRPEPDRSAIQQRLVQMLLRQGKLDEGRKMLAELATQHPENVQWMEELADLALDARDLTDAERWEQKIHLLEGDQGSIWRYYRARRLLLTTGTNAKQAIAEAQQLAEELKSQRPSWPETYLLQGLLAEQKRKLTEAVDAYRQAISLGDRHASVYERMIGLLYQTQQFDEASKLLSQLQPTANSSTALSSLAVALSLRQDDVDRAVGLAKNWVQCRPDDPIAQIWLGQAQLLAKKTAAAQQAFQRATELAPSDARGWQALFLFFVQSNQPDAARETLANIEAHTTLPAERKALILGQGYEMLGDMQEAEAQYRKVPNDPGLQQRLAALLLRSNSPQADAALEQAESSATGGAQRRKLALLLLSRGDRKSLDKALELLHQPNENPQEVPLNNRIQAIVLMRRGRGDDLQQAIQLLTVLVNDPRQVQAGDRLLLAGLLETDGKIQQARDQYQALAALPNPAPPHLAAYADFLVRSGYARDAEVWVKRLEEVAPGNFIATAVLRSLVA